MIHALLDVTAFEELHVPTANSFMNHDLISVKAEFATMTDISSVDDCRTGTAWLNRDEKYRSERPLVTPDLFSCKLVVQ